MRGARTIVDTCANVTAGEKVLIVADLETYKIAGLLFAALIERDIEPIVTIMLPRELDGQEPPPLVTAAMLEADVIIMPVSVSISHSTAVKKTLQNGARILAMSAFNEDLMYKGGIKADFVKQKVVCDRFADYFAKAERIEITSSAGTSFTASIAGRPGNSHACVVDTPGQYSAVVNIEANVSPVEGTSAGILVINGSVPNFGIGVVKTPIEMVVKNGAIIEIRGGREAKFLEELLASQNDPSVYNIAQIAVGLNPECKQLTGVMTNDHGAYGRVHIGIGTSHQLGGEVKAPLHFDVVMEGATVLFDGRPVIKNGDVIG